MVSPTEITFVFKILNVFHTVTAPSGVMRITWVIFCTPHDDLILRNNIVRQIKYCCDITDKTIQEFIDLYKNLTDFIKYSGNKHNFNKMGQLVCESRRMLIISYVSAVTIIIIYFSYVPCACKFC